MATDRGIVLMDDGTVTSYQDREMFTTRGERPEILRRLTVYQEDGTVRQLLGHADKKRLPPWIWHALGSGFWSGVPILSEPERTYEFAELKAELVNRLRGPSRSMIDGEKAMRAMKDANTFDEIFPFVPSVSKWE